MGTNTLFAKALGRPPPCEVMEMVFGSGGKGADIRVDFGSG